MATATSSKQRIFSSAENAFLNISLKYRGLFRVAEILRLQGPPIHLETLETAVRSLQGRHPVLRSRLRNHLAAPDRFLLEEDSALRLKVREVPRKRDEHLNFSAGEWREREKDIPVIGEGLAECWLLQDPDDYENDHTPREVIIICEHSVCDGISLSTVVHELLLALGEEDQSLFECSLEWPIPMEIAIERTLSKWNRFTTLSKFLVGAIYQRTTLGPKTTRIPYAHVDFSLADAHEHCHTETFYGSLDREVTKALFDRCHREGVTVTSAISAANLRAASASVQDKSGCLTHLLK